MKLFIRLAVPALVGLLALGASEKNAHALGPLDVEVGAKVGVGTNPSDGSNPLGFGLGARGGVSIYGLYAGLSAVHYFGSDDLSTTLLGVEVGYTIKAVPLLRIRPQIGIGNAHVSLSAGDLTVSSDSLYLEPGVAVIVPLGLLYVGADANALILPGHSTEGLHTDTETAFTLHAQVGVTF